MKTLLALAFTLMLTTPAQAAFVEYDFTGTGLSFGHLWLNTSAPDTDPAADRDIYHAVDGIRVGIRSYVDIIPQGPGLDVLTVVHTGAIDQVSLNLSYKAGWELGRLNLWWDEAPSQGSAFPSLGHITNGHYSVQWLPGYSAPPGEQAAALVGALTSLTPLGGPTPVPLPPSVWLFGAGLGVVLWMRGKKLLRD